MPPLPLVLVPGLMNDARVWRHQVAAWSAARAVHVADSTTHDSIVGIAKAALADAPAGRFALAGFSLGGYVALEMIRQAPDRIAALALVDTGSRNDTPDATAMRRRMIAAVDAGAANFDPVIASFLPRVVHPSRVGEAALTDELVAMARSVGIAGFVRQQNAAIGRADSRPALGDIRCADRRRVRPRRPGHTARAERGDGRADPRRATRRRRAVRAHGAARTPRRRHRRIGRLGECRLSREQAGVARRPTRAALIPSACRA